MLNFKKCFLNYVSFCRDSYSKSVCPFFFILKILFDPFFFFFIRAHVLRLKGYIKGHIIRNSLNSLSVIHTEQKRSKIRCRSLRVNVLVLFSLLLQQDVERFTDIEKLYLYLRLPSGPSSSSSSGSDKMWVFLKSYSFPLWLLITFHAVISVVRAEARGRSPCCQKQCVVYNMII